MNLKKSLGSMILVGVLLLAMSGWALADEGTLSERKVEKINLAGGKIYGSMANLQENTFISPVSIYLAYGMLYNGANTYTKASLSNLFGYDMMRAQHVLDTRYIMENVCQDQKGIEWNIANSLWLNKNLQESIHAKYVAGTEKDFQAKVAALDFYDQKNVAVINQWVKEQTKGMIPEILDSFDPNMMLYLINCVYFKGGWAQPFDVANTVQDTFKTTKGQLQKVDFMQQTEHFGYYADANMQAIKLPYMGHNTSMVVVLPKKELKTVHPFQKNQLKTIMKNMEKKKVDLTLPKVDIAYDGQEKFQQALEKNGLRELFVGPADLSGISDRPLKLGGTKHKTALKIDEKGSEAAAVTSIGVRTMSLPLPQETVTMKVNRPFYCAIVDEKTGLILFCGNIAKIK